MFSKKSINFIQISKVNVFTIEYYLFLTSYVTVAIFPLSSIWFQNNDFLKYVLKKVYSVLEMDYFATPTIVSWDKTAKAFTLTVQQAISPAAPTDP